MPDLLFDATLSSVVGGTKERLNAKHLAQLRQVALRCPAPAAITRGTSRTELQYYKDERLLTLYGFESIHHGAAAGGEASAWAWMELMLLAFGGRFPDASGDTYPFPTHLQYEHEISESKAFADEQHRSHKGGQGHPVLYVRHWAEPKVKRPGAHWEGPTQVDARAIWDHRLDHQRLYVEAKFLSDVSTDVTYCTARNQIARNIEAGLVDTMKSMQADQITTEVINRFWFMLLTPRLFKVDKPRARLYGFLMAEYMNDPDTIRRDLGHLDLDDEAWALVSSRIGWATWEDIRRIMESGQHKGYPSPDSTHMPSDTFLALQAFWDDRLVQVPKLRRVELRSISRVGTSSGWVNVESVDELRARLQRQGANRLQLGQMNPLTDTESFEGGSMKVQALGQEHLDWLLDGDHRFLDHR